MVVTRKIEVFVCEDNKDLRRAYYDKLYANRDIAVKVANMCASHLFALDNTMPYLSDEDKETVTFLGVKGDRSTRLTSRTYLFRIRLTGFLTFALRSMPMAMAKCVRDVSSP